MQEKYSAEMNDLRSAIWQMSALLEQRYGEKGSNVSHRGTRCEEEDSQMSLKTA